MKRIVNFCLAVTLGFIFVGYSNDNGHKRVQLWKDGPYWAETNIGAEMPWESGYHFWWGDTIGYKLVNDAWVASDGSRSRFSFDDDNTPTLGKSIAVLQKEGWMTSDGILAPEHDAANVHWGRGWRMPTKQELDDLRANCDWEWATLNGVKGYFVRGRHEYASASIFLPCAGFALGTSLLCSGARGIYGSSVPYSGNGNYYNAWYLNFISDAHKTYYDARNGGLSVRPVQGFTK